MSNSVHVHLEGYDKIEVCENLECSKEITPIKFGDDAIIFANKNHLEDLFQGLDEKLHHETYSDLEDKIFNLQSDFDDLVEQNTRLIEQAVSE